MSAAQTLGLAASFLAGIVFILAALRPFRKRVERAPPPPEPAAYWPILLGTNERTFDAATRFRIVQELSSTDGDWKIPILLCAREQERDPSIRSAIDAALGVVGKAVIGPPA